MEKTPNIGALIPIRLTSERLPGKALMKICDRPVTWHLLDRICASRYIDDPKKVVVCTTEEPESQPLVDSVTEYGCSVFRGHTDDIIARLNAAIDAFGFDAVIQADGDDPLSDTEYMDLEMEKLLADPNLDIVVSKGLPLGVATKAFTTKAMKRVISLYRSEKNDTGFIYYFTKSGLFNVGHVDPVGSEHILDEARLTLDYELDFKVFGSIFEHLYEPGKVFGLSKVVEFLKENPEISRLNLSVEEEYWERDAELSALEYFDASTGQMKTLPTG